MRTHVDLFSGIGGFSLAARWAGVETIAFAEIDPYASRVLERHFSGVRNYGDVRNVPSLSAWLLTAGVPCQPASVAGKRRGAADDRWLWPEALAVVENGNYEWLLFENPTGILSLNDGVEFERICLALEGQGYAVQPIVIPACGVGAPHRRNRIWIMAHAPSRNAWRGSKQFQGKESSDREPPLVLSDPSGRSGASTAGNHNRADTNTNEPGPQGRIGRELQERAGEQFAGSSDSHSLANPVITERGRPTRLKGRVGQHHETERNGRGESGQADGEWLPEPDVGRVAHGIPARVDRLRTLGNAIVPQVACQLIKRMIEAEEAA